MGKVPKTNLFLQRQGYRRRRVADAARALPVVGGVLIMLPLLWPQAEGGEAAGKQATLTSGATIYVFAIWIGVIIGAALLAPRLMRKNDE